MKHPLSPYELSVVRELRHHERAFSAFLEQLECGWRDGDGLQLPTADVLQERLSREIDTIERHLDQARFALTAMDRRSMTTTATTVAAV